MAFKQTSTWDLVWQNGHWGHSSRTKSYLKVWRNLIKHQVDGDRNNQLLLRWALLAVKKDSGNHKLILSILETQHQHKLLVLGKLASPSEVVQQVAEKQYPPHRPSPYSCQQYSLSFPQHSLPQGVMYSNKPHQSLEGPPWLFLALAICCLWGPISFPIHGHSGGYPRKKISSLNPAYSQYSRKV